MLDLGTNNPADDDEVPVFETIGVKDVNNKGIENEGDEAYDINDDETVFLDADGETEPDEFSGKSIELDNLPAMEIFDLESTDLDDDDDDDDELPAFEAIGLASVDDKCIGNEDEGAYGINDVKAAVIDSDAKMKSDDFNKNCSKLVDFLAMLMFELESTDLDDDNGLPLFKTI